MSYLVLTKTFWPLSGKCKCLVSCQLAHQHPTSTVACTTDLWDCLGSLTALCSGELGSSRATIDPGFPGKAGRFRNTKAFPLKEWLSVSKTRFCLLVLNSDEIIFCKSSIFFKDFQGKKKVCSWNMIQVGTSVLKSVSFLTMTDLELRTWKLWKKFTQENFII